MRRFIIPVTFVLFLFSCKSRSAQNADLKKDSLIIVPLTPEKISKVDIANYQAKLAVILDSTLIKHRFNGGIIVAKGGNILYEKYAGFINPNKKTDSITESTSFHLASTSKPFTGVAILKLVEQNKINLLADVTQYLPKFPYQGITVKDLLSHRSGLPNYLYFMGDKEKWPINKMISNEDVLNFMALHKPELNYRPGTRFNYCNTNFVLLASIIEAVTNKSYPQYLNETIFKPLNMKHTFVYTPSDSGKVAVSYKPSGALWGFDIFDNTYGDKNIYSTPKDMVKWDAALYNDQFIRQSLLDSAFQPLSNETPSIHNYGLGWRMLNLANGKKVIYHNGKWHGFTPAFARLLDEKAVIIVLGNQYNMNMYNAAKAAYNVFGDYAQNSLIITEEPQVK